MFVDRPMRLSANMYTPAMYLAVSAMVLEALQVGFVPALPALQASYVHHGKEPYAAGVVGFLWYSTWAWAVSAERVASFQNAL